MLTPIEFLAEHRYQSLIITEPNEIDTQWRCEMRVEGNMFTGFGDNGYQAFVAALKRLKDTDPDTGVMTITINPDRESGPHRKE